MYLPTFLLLLVACAVVAAVIVLSVGTALQSRNPRSRYLRFVVLAAFFAAITPVLYLLDALEDSRWAWAGGNLCMVLAPAVFWAGLVAQRLARAIVAAVSAVALFLFLFTLFGNPDLGDFLKYIALIAICIGAVITTSRLPARRPRQRAGALILAFSYVGYTVYALLRVITTIIDPGGASSLAMSIASNMCALVAVVGVALGALLLSRADDERMATERMPTREDIAARERAFRAQGIASVLCVLDLVDSELIRTAHPTQTEAVIAAFWRAADAAAAIGSPDGSETRALRFAPARAGMVIPQRRVADARRVCNSCFDDEMAALGIHEITSVNLVGQVLPIDPDQMEESYEAAGAPTP